MPGRFKLMALPLALALLLAACAPTATPEGAQQDVTSTVESVIPAPNALASFDGCEAFLDYVIGHALEVVGPYGLDGGSFWPVAERMETDDLAGGEAAPDSFSTTNVQVEGVDEPDIVKSDGDRIVVVAQGSLIVVDVSGDEPIEVGRLGLNGIPVEGMFLSGDNVLLFGSTWGAGPIPLSDAGVDFAPMPGSSKLVVTEVELSGGPHVARTLTVDGAYASARQVGESVRIVLSSGPLGFEWSYPSGSGLRAERTALEENREIIRNSTPENWIPYYVIADADGDVTDEGMLFDCDRARHPKEFSGLDMLTVLTLGDDDSGFEVRDATGVLATGGTVYATADSLYVATQDWRTLRWVGGDESSEPEGPKTEIHKFDISGRDSSDYVASGVVDGFLLNQFAMDEFEGMLRVASTTSPAGWGWGEDSVSQVTVLRQIGESLVEVGGVGGLGETERIYAVRFIGEVGYVVTFRQTDPLYTIDLSDPRSPDVVGELKIPGYSAYLHPLGDGRLLGVGRDADDSGVVAGMQLSLFDVSDLADPIRLDTATLSDGTSSEAEYNHHAFLLWRGKVVLPVQEWRWDEKSESGFVGAIVVDVEGGLGEVGRIAHPGGDGSGKGGPDWQAQIIRSVAVGDALYTISSKGVMKSDIESLDTLAWLDF